MVSTCNDMDAIFAGNERVRALLEAVPDPEIPVLSVVDLGVIRGIHAEADKKRIAVTVTPTYSGCPAMDVMRVSIRMALLAAGFEWVELIIRLSPAWTTDWITEAGAEKLKAYGIAPPLKVRHRAELFAEPVAIECPQCRSLHTALISEFGSTACKSLHRCADCGEPFEHFKCH